MKIIIIILQAILNLVRKRRDLIANTDKIPSAIKKSIIAWYSPKKQKLINYDVIESYAENFLSNKWVNTENVNATITSKTITYTRRVDDRNRILSTNKPCESFIIYATVSTYAWRYQYVDENEIVQFYDIKNGINVLPKSYNNKGVTIGFLWMGNNIEASISITQLPTSILKDFSGNGHDAYMYGFQGKLNSGVGIYAQDFKNWSYGSSINKDISTKSYNKFHIVKKKADNWFGFTIGIQKDNYYNKPYKLKFNINKKIDDTKFNIVSTDGNLITTTAYSVYINDGSIIDVPIISEEIFNNKEETYIYYDFGTNKDIEIDVELIADYPNQLCYDGKSYAVVYDMPILTDYTVMAERTWLERQNRACFLSKITTSGTGAFGFEFYNEYNEDTTYSFGRVNNVEQFKDGITYQITNSYNGIVKLDYIVNGKDNAELYIGKLRLSEHTAFIGCHGDILLFNRSLTDDELDLVKEHFFGIVRIKDALLTVDGKPIITTDNKYIKLNKNNNYGD